MANENKALETLKSVLAKRDSTNMTKWYYTCSYRHCQKPFTTENRYRIFCTDCTRKKKPPLKDKIDMRIFFKVKKKVKK